VGVSEGKWSGGIANRTWSRFSGARVVEFSGDAERSARLDVALAGESFWCEACGQVHPLRQHRECRSAR
jgi:hypothetical protein